MESSDPARFMDDLLDFGSGEEEEEEEDEEDVEEEGPTQNGAARNKKAVPPPSFTPTALGSALLTVLRPDDCSGPFADSPLIEEELEWISNKDAFPAVETFPGFLSSHHDDVFLTAKQSSPVSVLDTTTSITLINNSSSSNGGRSSSIVKNCCVALPVPLKKKVRSKRRPPQQLQCSWYKHQGIFERHARVRRAPLRMALGRKCQHCEVEKTPQWRAGPHGAKTLCNACGVRYKSGRLVPEYRPANSPTFCSELHSNSHRKVVEMRRQKEMTGLPVAHSMDKGVG